MAATRYSVSSNTSGSERDFTILPTDRDWEARKDEIIHFYRDRECTLNVVLKMIQEKYQWKVTPRMFKTRFDKWGIRKYQKHIPRRPRPVRSSRRKQQPSPPSTSPALSTITPSSSSAVPSVLPASRSPIDISISYPYCQPVPIVGQPAAPQRYGFYGQQYEFVSGVSSMGGLPYPGQMTPTPPPVRGAAPYYEGGYSDVPSHPHHPVDHSPHHQHHSQHPVVESHHHSAPSVVQSHNPQHPSMFPMDNSLSPTATTAIDIPSEQPSRHIKDFCQSCPISVVTAAESLLVEIPHDTPGLTGIRDLQRRLVVMSDISSMVRSALSCNRARRQDFEAAVRPLFTPYEPSVFAGIIGLVRHCVSRSLPIARLLLFTLEDAALVTLSPAHPLARLVICLQEFVMSSNPTTIEGFFDQMIIEKIGQAIYNRFDRGSPMAVRLFADVNAQWAVDPAGIMIYSADLFKDMVERVSRAPDTEVDAYMPMVSYSEFSDLASSSVIVSIGLALAESLTTINNFAAAMSIITTVISRIERQRTAPWNPTPLTPEATNDLSVIDRAASRAYWIRCRVMYLGHMVGSWVDVIDDLYRAVDAASRIRDGEGWSLVIGEAMGMFEAKDDKEGFAEVKVLEGGYRW